MVDAIIQLSIVINFILAVLVSTSRSELENLFLLIHGRHFEDATEESVDIGHG